VLSARAGANGPRCRVDGAIESKAYTRATVARHHGTVHHRGHARGIAEIGLLSVDAAASMREQIKREGATVIGSTGQPAAHSLIPCEGAAQKRVAQFLKQLGLFNEARSRATAEAWRPSDADAQTWRKALIEATVITARVPSP
jgi:hypothetical protein